MKIGFIGCGNMASAMIGGILRQGIFSKDEIIVSNLTDEGRARSEKTLGVVTTLDNNEIVRSAKTVVLAVKPQFYEEVLNAVRYMLTPDHVIISLAPGRTIDQLKLNLGNDKRIVRVMPNTPAMIGEGMTGISCRKEEFTDEELDVLTRIFSSCGKAEYIEERLMDAVVCASGSSPAFVYMFIEALADGAVRCGMPRKQAYIFAAQAVKGAASMVLETGEHPGVLKDQVCSPAGTTIAGVAALEETGFRNAVLKGCEAVYKKCIEI